MAMAKAVTAGGTRTKTEKIKGMVFNIQRFTLHDGPGIRTLVFLKGCPLHCRWCDNPEGINRWPELGFIKIHCNQCGKCVAACSKQAIVLSSDGMPEIDSQLCTNCGDCTTVCLPEALVLYGKEMSAAEVLEAVQQDQMFYGNSGGVTVSGGEPLRQASFVEALFKLCREAGVHTVLETSGFASRNALEKVLKLTDYVLFDIKHMDSSIHQKFTGRTNTRILENARIVARSGVPVLFRTPLIPGVNDDLENISETARFLKTLESKATLELMPYHRLGKDKYEALRSSYRLEELQPHDPEQVESVRQAYEDLGISCTISR